MTPGEFDPQSGLWKSSRMALEPDLINQVVKVPVGLKDLGFVHV